MPLGLGLASSHPAPIFTGAEHWPRIYQALIADVPQPPEAAAETPAVLAEYVQRVRRALGALRERLEAYRPEALIIVGDDQTEVFSPVFNPTFAIYTGEEVSGSTAIRFIGERPEDHWVTLRCHAELARALHRGLLERGFDLTAVEELRPLGRPDGGLGHAYTRLARALGVVNSGLPTVVFFLNAYNPPLPSAARCYRLGQALRDVLARRPERVAVLASGGLAHDPRGPRAGWVDEPLDRWVLERLAAGEGDALQHLYTFDSDTLRSGTGEIRSWITAAGAFAGVRATVLDYIPARHAVTGLGFAYWLPEHGTAWSRGGE